MTANRRHQPTDETRSDENQGEGNREAARAYNADQQEFVKSGKVKSAARAAAPRSKREANEMREAERKGKKKARK